MPRMIGLDLGTTTISGLLLDTERGEVLRLAQRRNDAAVPQVLSTRAEQDPHRLRALALEVLAELSDHSLDGIALTGQKHGLLCVDGSGRPLTPLISWQDQRTSERPPAALTGQTQATPTILEQLHSRLQDLDWHENGCRVAHGYGAATLFWLVQQGELPAGTHRVCTVADWLAGRLAGQAPVTDPTFAASWGVYSLVEEDWNTAFLERLGLPVRLFPPVQPSGQRLGGLAPDVAREIGLPPGLPVFNALGDTQASFLGAFPLLAGGREGELPLARTIFFNLGTGGQIAWMVPRFEPPTEAVETRPLLPGRFLRVGASLCGGAAYAWLKDTVCAWLAEFGVKVGEQAVYERLNALAAECKDSGGLRVRTTFLGVRGNATIEAGSIEGINLENMHLGALARATLAGIVDELYDLYRTHVSATIHHQQVVATGGGVRQNPLLPGLIEARFRLPLQIPLQRETAALGAARSAHHRLSVPTDGGRLVTAKG
jgi:sedoheptulokinase